MEVREVEVVGYSPWVGEGGVEGALIRSDNGECLLLTGPVAVQLLGMKPTRKSRASASSNGQQRESVAVPPVGGNDLLCPDDPKCGFVGKNKLSLGIHRSKIHGYKGVKKRAAKAARKPAKRRAA